MNCSFLIYQCYNSLILTIPFPPPISAWPNPHEHPPMPSLSTVPESLEHILAVPKHGCLKTSNDACRLNHGTCHLFQSPIGLQWESVICIVVYKSFFSSDTLLLEKFFFFTAKCPGADSVNHMWNFPISLVNFFLKNAVPRKDWKA